MKIKNIRSHACWILYVVNQFCVGLPSLLPSAWGFLGEKILQLFSEQLRMPLQGATSRPQLNDSARKRLHATTSCSASPPPVTFLFSLSSPCP